MRGRARARPDEHYSGRIRATVWCFNEGAGTCPPGLPYAFR